MHNIKNPLLVWILLYSISTFSQATVTGELQKWHTVALTFNGPNSSEDNPVNPFLDYRLNVTFSSPSGKTLTVPGFYAADGNAAETSANSGNKWRVRFTPNEIGKWSYSVSFRTGTNVAVNSRANAGSVTSFNGSSGNFNISASTKNVPDNRAKGRLNYVGERYLQFEETGEYFLKAGSDSPENLLAYDDFDNTVGKKTWGPHARDWKNGDPSWKGDNGKELIGAINYLAQKGMNAFSFMPMTVNGDGKDVWPWSALNNNDLDGNSSAEAQNRTRYDVSKLAQWEILFSHADAKGMYLHFKTQEIENELLLDEGDLGTQRKLYYRELIARFGHHLALNWNLGEESSLYKKLNDNQNTRIKEYISYIRDTDPYDHNIVIHSLPNTGDQENQYRPLLGDQSYLTGASAQIQINKIHAGIKKWVSESKNAGKPWVVANDEQGDLDSGVTADESFSGRKGVKADNRKGTRHKVLWGTLMAGGAGVEYYFGYDTGETDLTAQNFRSRDSKWDDAKKAIDFFNNYLSFWEMDTNDEITSASNDYCLAKLNDTYAIYLPNGGSTNVNLSNANGSFTVQWYNPVDGGALVNGTVTQINGGGNRSIGFPPSNRSSDWVALVQNEESTYRTEDKSCNLDFYATSDFTDFTVSGFSPAYLDNERKALAINAGQFKDKFAAAETTFNGQTGTYNITLNTLSELDGESSYKLRINGELVGSYTNRTTTVDYAPAGTTFKNIMVNNGDTVRVEFNSHTNGKIPEGNSTAYSRGRWTSLNFECQVDISNEPSGDCDADVEENNGLVVIEAENLDSPSGWVNSTAATGFTGNGYIDWQGADSFGTPGKGTISAKIKINTPGTYLFQWRSKVGEGTNPTESNDSWLRFPDADDFFGKRGNSMVYPKGSGKTPNPKGATSDGWFKVFLGGTTNWTWASSTSDFDAHNIYVKFDKAGIYTMEVSGRSKHHLIDRMVLSKNVSNATDLSLKETPCTGADVASVPVTSVTVSSKKSTVKVGNTLGLNAQVSPTNATNKNIVWSSSNTDIATVDQNGVITAMGEGTATIYVTTEDGGYRDDTIIEVIPGSSDDIAVTGISISQTSATVVEGNSIILNNEIVPGNATNKQVTWTSSDTTIATVNQNGTVTASKVGDVSISVTSQDGGFTKTSVIKVIEKPTVGTAVQGIFVTPQRLTIETGRTARLKYRINPSNATNQNAIWSSSDTSIATVDQNGIVTALKKGDVEIEAVSEDGSYRSDSTVRVIMGTGDVVSVTGIAISQASVSVVEGNSIILDYDIIPKNASNKRVFWSSSNGIIASVNQSGTVTGSKIGEVIITLKSEDGGFISTIKVNVVEKPTVSNPVTGIYVTPQFLTLEVGSAAGLSYRIRPLNASNKDVIWRSEDPSIATVDENGNVTALRAGKVEIEATTVDGQFRSDSSVNVVPSSSKNEQAIIAYPNPTHDEVRIGGIQGKSGWVGVYTFNGVLLLQKNVKGGEEAVISLAGHPAGTYVIKVLDSRKSKTKTVIKM